MRWFSFLLIVLTAAVSAKAAKDEKRANGALTHKEVLTCKLTKISGMFGSFAPPTVGSTITFDLSKNSMGKLMFPGAGSSGGYIPTIVPLEKQNNKVSWRQHQVFYLGERTAHGATTAVQLTIGRYGDFDDPIEKRPWAARIQSLHKPHNANWTLEQADLACTLLKNK